MELNRNQPRKCPRLLQRNPHTTYCQLLGHRTNSQVHCNLHLKSVAHSLLAMYRGKQLEIKMEQSTISKRKSIVYIDTEHFVQN